MNAAPPPLGFLELLIGLAVLAGGLVLLGRGWRGARRGDEPHCRRCGYALVGIASDKCPECGAGLADPGAVVRGERVRRPGLVWAGAVLTLLGLGVLLVPSLGLLDRVNWYAWQPTGWVIDDLESGLSAGAAGKAGRAWGELQRRAKSGGLGGPHRGRLVGVVLAHQGAAGPIALPAVAQPMIDWLGGEVVAGRVTDAQRDRFFRQSLRLTLTVRPTVALGDPVPFSLRHEGRGASGQGWWTRIEHQGVTIDGKQVRGPGGSSGFSGLSAGGSTGSSVRADAPGVHKVAVSVRVKVFHTTAGFASSETTPPLHEWDVTLEGTTEVTATPPADLVKPAGADVPPAAVRAAITPREFRWRKVNWNQKAPLPVELSGSIEMNPAPANLAFEVIAVAPDGKEHRVGSVTLKKGASTNWHVSGAAGVFGADRPASLDIILRSSESVARGTIDLYDYWKGEVVWERVPVREDDRVTR